MNVTEQTFSEVHAKTLKNIKKSIIVECLFIIISIVLLIINLIGLFKTSTDNILGVFIILGLVISLITINMCVRSINNLIKIRAEYLKIIDTLNQESK